MKATLLSALLLQLALALAKEGEREKRSILVPPGYRRPPIYPVDGGFFPIRPRVPFPQFNMTAKETFDPVNQICCEGNVFPNPKHADTSCCEANAFDRNNHFCCEGVVKEKEKGVKCCGKDTFNPEKAICCNGNVIPVTADELDKAECCGKDKYDPSKSLCCGGLQELKILEKKSEDDYCCGMEVANSKKQVCCSDLTTKGREIVDNTFHVVAKEENSNETICCWGGKLYDPAVKTCCSTELIDGVNQVCCGSKAIDMENQLCCRGDDGEFKPITGKAPESRCCGGKAGSVEKQICCNGNLFDRTDSSSFCCGDKAVNGKEALCVLTADKNGTTFETIKKSDPKQNDVCGSEPYDMRSQRCCPNFDGVKVVAKASTGSNLCCGDQTYEWSKATCCMDRTTKQVKLHQNTDYTIDCCGLDTYDTSTEICCGGKKKPRTDNDRCCGNSDIYNTKSDLCCFEYGKENTDLKFAVMPRTNTTACCGLKAFDYTKEICCNGKTYLNDGKTLCCGEQSYNAEKQTCCGGTILPVKDTKATSACCYYGLGSRSTDFDVTIIKETYYTYDKKR